jgi:protein-disulfide isomerase
MSAKARPAKKSYLPFVIIGVVLLAVIAAGAYVLNSRKSPPAGSSAGGAGPTAPGKLSPAPPRRNATPGAQPAHEKGGANAAVVLEEFGDYQCPPCGAIHPWLQKIKDDYGDRVKIIFRNYPLQQMHRNAFSAARAAEAAGMQGKFWEMNDLIFDNQAEWKDSPEPRPIFAGYARRLGLDEAKFKADSESKAAADRVIADFNRGNSLGVTGTPTIFLNGRELPAAVTLSERGLRAEVEAALASAQGGK